VEQAGVCEDLLMRAAGHDRLAGGDPLTAAGVSAREAEVLAAIGQRLNNREIAGRLVISVRTVESHVSSLLRKLSAADRAQLGRIARELPAPPGGAVPGTVAISGPGSIPAPLASLVGRDADLAEVERRLAGSPLVTVTGPAGCGKTSLALEVARRWAAGARVIELASAPATAAPATATTARPVTPPLPASALPREVAALVAAGLGIGFETPDLVTAAAMALGGRNMLVVIDNCEHVIEAAAAVATALARSVPGLRVLTTSREPLAADGEHVLTLAPLDVPAGNTRADVEASAAGRLFAERARAAAPHFRLDKQTAPSVAAACRDLDGLPLAIELAAARIRDLDAGELAASLRDGAAVSVLDPARPGQRSLAMAINWSWRLLDATERALLRRLAVLPADFTLALAQAACATPEAPDVRGTLVRLVEKSLITMAVSSTGALPSPGPLAGGWRPAWPARYRMLAVIRAHILARPDAAADEQVARAHARYCAERLAGQDAGGQGAAGLDEPNALAALWWAARSRAGPGDAGDPDPHLASSLLTTVSLRAALEPSRAALELIRDVTARPPAGPRGWSSQALATAAVALSFLSLDHAQQAAAGSREAVATERDRAFADWAAGWVLAYRGDEGAALSHLKHAIGYGRAHGDAWLEASALQARAISRARPQDAIADWEAAVTRFTTAGDPAWAGNARYMLASAAVEAGIRLDDVPVWLTECEAHATRQGLRLELAHARLTRARYELWYGAGGGGDPGAARPLLARALPAFRQAGDFRCVARSLVALARIAASPAGQPGAPGGGDDPARATEYLLEALRAAVISAGPGLRAQILSALVAAAAQAGDLVLAARCAGARDALAAGPAAEAAGDAPVPDVMAQLARPAYATYVEEGRAGGIRAITALYPRLPGLPDGTAPGAY
jgi:predicted ATPase/DNA-binding CsgD family transcriptional regulator